MLCNLDYVICSIVGIYVVYCFVRNTIKHSSCLLKTFLYQAICLLQLDRFIEAEIHTSFNPDGLASSHPIFVPVNHPDEITEIFDLISYRKVNI